MIALVDYGAGNLTSVHKGLNAAGASIFTPATPGDLASARGIIIPGVGHFGSTRAIDEAWRQAILDAADTGTPLLGICLGLQFLFEGSTEAPDVRGLGILRGHCALLPPTQKVPHVGWNSLEVRPGSRLLAGIEPGEFVYFTHSYKAPVTSDTASVTNYIEPFASAAERGNVMGVQFHPEKSGETGLKVLRNFLNLRQEGGAC